MCAMEGVGYRMISTIYKGVTYRTFGIELFNLAKWMIGTGNIIWGEL